MLEQLYQLAAAKKRQQPRSSAVGSFLAPNTAYRMLNPLETATPTPAPTDPGPYTPTVPTVTPATPGAPAAGAGDTKTKTATKTANSDYSADPVLQKIKAAAEGDIAEAETAALAGKREALAALGDPELAKKILGVDDPTIAGISRDPEKSTSTLARILRAYKQTVKTNEDSLNEHNLFYGGYRGTVLKDLSLDKQTQEADAAAATQQALNAIGQALLQAKRDARNRVLQGEADAYGRVKTDPGSGGDGGDDPPPAFPGWKQNENGGYTNSSPLGNTWTTAPGQNPTEALIALALGANYDYKPDYIAPEAKKKPGMNELYRLLNP